MSPIKVEQVVGPVVLGEGPHWDADLQCLFFVSILDCTIHKYVPATGKETRTKLSGRVGFIVPVEGRRDHFVVGVERKVLVIRWNGESDAEVDIVKELAEVDQHAPTTRLNDAKVDPRGRLFAGTMGKEASPGHVEKGKGSLYRFDADGSYKQLVDNVTIANGLAWDVSRQAFYYIDSMDFAVRRYEYDVNTGVIANKIMIFNLIDNKIEGFPDGMTIDADGNLWIAVFEGSQVVKVDPTTGKLLQKVAIPALQVTSVTFGGPNLDVLYVTSASMKKDPKVPSCGATFKVTGLGVKGLPAMSYKLK